MTVMQKRAFELIRRLPDDKIYYVIRILENVEGLVMPAETNGKTRELQAYENLQHFRKCSDQEIDYKAELAEALEEKYARVD